ncbi:MAG: aminotransferase class V-fold PLP-dependent enzyme [Candidatus Heimdallarchaeota archaeon]|nr:MAG: aminotransferase class V-fold PLP-dependent enzyme [Candidatus Heimdallarchaeota archaeon]
MDLNEFQRFGHQLIDWMVEYLKNVEKYPVKSQVTPKEIINKLPLSAPIKGEDFTTIFTDFEKIILPGITHWQSPNFFAYFPANSSYASMLAEMLMTTLGAQCMSWVTSPAATELEERVMEWLRDMIGLPKDFSGVIQDTASTSTICSLLTAREKLTNYEINSTGMNDKGILTIYCSTETHSSIEKAVKIVGVGKEHLRKIPVDENYALCSEPLEEAIKSDIDNEMKPMAVVATIGTTGSTAIDSLKKIGEICSKYKIWLHVDAALAGTAFILPEYRWMIEGIEYADTFVFNPHKWMFTNFDCSAYFIKDPEALVRTFEILPEYLKTKAEGVKNFRDWGLQLGRRFRALKLWFVIRNFGIEGLQQKIKYHIDLAKYLNQKIEKSPDFELLAPVPLNTLCFRYHPTTLNNEEELNRVNEELIHRLNETGKLYMTHTKLDGKYTLRFVTGQTYTQKKHVDKAWLLIQEEAQKLA